MLLGSFFELYYPPHYKVGIGVEDALRGTCDAPLRLVRQDEDPDSEREKVVIVNGPGFFSASRL